MRLADGERRTRETVDALPELNVALDFVSAFHEFERQLDFIWAD